MAEIKPISSLDAATTVATGDQLLLNVKGASDTTYTTSVISPSDFGNQIGSYLTIPYLSTTAGGQVAAKVQIDPSGEGNSVALEIGTASGGAGSSTFTRNVRLRSVVMETLHGLILKLLSIKLGMQQSMLLFFR